jgi:hypothetical protein
MAEIRMLCDNRIELQRWSKGFGVVVESQGVEIMIVVPDLAALDLLQNVLPGAVSNAESGFDVVFYPTTRLPASVTLSSRARLGGVAAAGSVPERVLVRLGVGHGNRAELDREQDEMTRIPCQGEEK